MSDAPTGRKSVPRKGVHENRSALFIPLTNGRVAIIEPADWSRVVAKYGARWHANSNGFGRWYARKEVTLTDGRVVMLTLARAVTDAKRGERVETRNGNALDVRRSNLRVVKPRKTRMPRPPRNRNPEVRP